MFNWLRREPKRLVERRHHISQAFADYPIYQPLHRQGPNSPRLQNPSEENIKLAREFAARGRENFGHFMEQRQARLAALGVFLTRFNVKTNLDDKGIANVSEWLPGNCGALVAELHRKKTRQAFFQPTLPWKGPLLGFNAIFDLGIYLGECVVARNQRLHWIYRPGASDDGSANHSGYQINGFKNRRDWLDPMGTMLDLCGDDEDDLRTGNVGRRVKWDRLVHTVRDYSTR